jgi:hypothetical protein
LQKHLRNRYKGNKVAQRRAAIAEFGPELGTGPTNYRAEIMKVWPERAPIEILTPAQFKPRIDKLVLGHCK